MFAKVAGYFYFSIFSLFVLLHLACQEEKSEDLYFVPTQLEFFGDKLLAIGTSYSHATIRYPSIAEVGKSPSVYRSETSARGIKLKTVAEQKQYLSYYQAKSLQQQEEHSKIFTINNQTLDNISSFGSRTRIIDFLPLANDTILCLNYKRATTNSSLVWLAKNRIIQEKIIEIGQETTIPKQLLQLSNSDLLILGTADGFAFKDGHSYEEEFAKGFINQTNKDGEQINQWRKSSDNGHVFFKHVIMANDFIYIVGEIQQEENGMDVFISKLNKECKLIGEYILEKTQHQTVLDINHSSNSIELLMKDNVGKQSRVFISTFDLELNHLNSDESVIIESTDLVDAINKEDNYYVLGHQKEKRTDIPTSVILKINKEGTILETIEVLPN